MSANQSEGRLESGLTPTGQVNNPAEADTVLLLSTHLALQMFSHGQIELLIWIDGREEWLAIPIDSDVAEVLNENLSLKVEGT